MDNVKSIDQSDASVIRGGNHMGEASASGVFEARCFDAEGNLKWEDTFNNIITDVGANLLLDQLFGTATTYNSYLGLISGVGYTSVPVVGHTMASHGTWTEAGDATNTPQWSTPASSARATLSWGAAGSRAKSITTASFTISTTGPVTVKGCFIVTGSGASSAHDNTGGVLYSAGLFSGGDKSVGVNDVLQVSYTTTINAS